jgi:hypothetical protein
MVAHKGSAETPVDERSAVAVVEVAVTASYTGSSDAMGLELAGT